VAHQVVIEAVDIYKAFGHIQALQGASLQVRSGEILALVGDNGAGKSTLTNVICGALRPDRGRLVFWGTDTTLQSIQHAQELGVETVYQDLALAPDLSVVDSVYLGREPIASSGWRRWTRTIARDVMYERTDAALRNLGIGLHSLRIPIRTLSGGERQAVAVARAVLWAKTVILMDEPTAALGTKQSAIVYRTMRAAAERGLAVVVVSHDIPRMLKIADRIVVMRHGQTITNRIASELTLADVVGLILGSAETSAA
jgi:simple sugar transport system ATP-binding protein